MRSRGLLALIIGGIAIAVAACGSSPTVSSLEQGSLAAASQGVASSAPVAIKPATEKSSQEVSRIFDVYSVPEAGSSAADYLIAPMDVVEVTVFEAPNLSRTAQVGASGGITLPLIEDVQAAGKTTEQLQREIVMRLKHFMQAPQVFVAVKEYNSQRVTVDGAVKSPGVFPLKGETTLMQALALSGGLNEMASPSGIFVLRKVDGKKLAARFDLKEIRSGKTEDPVLRAGDIVVVDESRGKVALKGLREAMGLTSGIFGLLML